MFTETNARFESEKGKVTLRDLNRPKPIAQAVWFQDKLRKAANDKGTTASALAQLARAWEVLEERKAILRGIGAPKPVLAANDPTVKPKTPKQSSQSFTESSDGEVAPVKARKPKSAGPSCGVKPD